MQTRESGSKKPARCHTCMAPHTAYGGRDALPLCRIITPLRPQLGRSKPLNYSHSGWAGHGRQRKWCIKVIQKIMSRVESQRISTEEPFRSAKPPVDSVPAPPAADGPLLQLPTARTRWRNIPKLCQREVFTVLNGPPVCTID